MTNKIMIMIELFSTRKFTLLLNLHLIYILCEMGLCAFLVQITTIIIMPE